VELLEEKSMNATRLGRFLLCCALAAFTLFAQAGNILGVVGSTIVRGQTYGNYLASVIQPDGTNNVQTNAVWSISNSAAGTIDANGLFTAANVSANTVTNINVTAGGLSGTLQVTVIPEGGQTPFGFAVDGQLDITGGQTASYTAETTYNGNAANPTFVTPTWSVAPTTYASINAAGVVSTTPVTSPQTVIVTGTYITPDGFHQWTTQQIWILPAVTASCTAGAKPCFAGNATGADANLSLSITVQPATADVGQYGANYVLAIAPVLGTNVILAYTANGWQDVTNIPLTQVQPYSTGNLGSAIIQALSGANVSGVQGAVIYAGYGAGASGATNAQLWSAMLTNGTYAKVYTVN
jgi:hypothetical protein